jgi:hypothetical protein
MQNVSCPSCGAQVRFRSHASVMAVCEYCKTTVLKDADSVKDLGKMSDVLEDYSPIRIGTSGVFGGRSFTVIARIQLRYSAGLWNEWHVLFDDGQAAWLGDASGQYTLSTEKAAEQQLPAFAELAPAQSLTIGINNYTVADVRVADCTGGQGELPFKIGQGWQARVADLRTGGIFLTLDYSDREQPRIYAGQAVTLEELKCQLLRDDDEVKTSAGKFKGKVEPLGCPSCGSNVTYVPGMTTHIVCPGCHAQVDTTARVAQVLAAGTCMAGVRTTLELGAKAAISGRQYQLIGVMQRRDDEGAAWTEYLLHSARAGFLWLIETDEGWACASVQDITPSWNQGDSAVLGNRTFKKLCDYTAQVTFAAGAFNWRAGVGDKARVIEFESRTNRLAAEITREEITWSLSSPVAADQIRAWFGSKVQAEKRAPKEELGDLPGKFIMGLLAANAIPLLFAFTSTWSYVALGAAAVYFPAKYLAMFGESET